MSLPYSWTMVATPQPVRKDRNEPCCMVGWDIFVRKVTHFPCGRSRHQFWIVLTTVTHGPGDKRTQSFEHCKAHQFWPHRLHHSTCTHPPPFSFLSFRKWWLCQSDVFNMLYGFPVEWIVACWHLSGLPHRELVFTLSGNVPAMFPCRTCS